MKATYHNRVLLIVALTLVVACAPRALGQCPGEGSWTQATPMPDPRGEICGAVVGGKVYVFGDYNSSPIMNRVEVYDPQTNAWTQLANMPTGRGQAAAAAVDGIIYVFGGNNCFSNCWLTTNEAYDPATDTWTTRAPMQATDRGMFTATAVGGLIYVMGGADSYDPSQPYDIVEVYDPATDSWILAAPLPRGRSHHGAVTLEQKIYLIGGVTGIPYQQISEVDVFDTVTGVWTQAAPLPTPRMSLTAATAGGRIYAIGGRDYPAGASLSIVDEYDPQLDCWSRVTPLPSGRRRLWAGSVDGTIFAIGGYDSNGAFAQNFLGAPRPIAGDMNGDGLVNGLDLSFFVAKLLNP